MKKKDLIDDYMEDFDQTYGNSPILRNIIKKYLSQFYDDVIRHLKNEAKTDWICLLTIVHTGYTLVHMLAITQPIMESMKYVLEMLETDLKDETEALDKLIKENGNSVDSESIIFQRGYVSGLDWAVKNLKLNS